MGDDPCRGQGAWHSYGDAGGNQAQSLAKDHRKNTAAPGSQRDPDADLPSSPGDGIAHQSQEPDCRQQRGQDSEEARQPRKQPFLHQVLVDDPDLSFHIVDGQPRVDLAEHLANHRYERLGARCRSDVECDSADQRRRHRIGDVISRGHRLPRVGIFGALNHPDYFEFIAGIKPRKSLCRSSSVPPSNQADFSDHLKADWLECISTWTIYSYAPIRALPKAKNSFASVCMKVPQI